MAPDSVGNGHGWKWTLGRAPDQVKGPDPADPLGFSGPMLGCSANGVDGRR